MLYVVSACLLGENCKYNGGNNYNEKVAAFVEDHSYIMICPETSGGLKTPRVPAEMAGGTGNEVLAGKAAVVSEDGTDVTQEFVTGAYLSLEDIIEAAEEGEEIMAILKSKSPSCGTGTVYDGSFQDRLIPGDGVTAALLKSKGIKVLTEQDI
ncbi:MAG: DUF523 domain-containing protein [Clostridiales bacterium]|nr:DUF523 domain-containing protein [Clostridiales bacterium]